MPYKHPFTPSELVNKHNLSVMTKVAEIFNKYGGGPCDRSIILEDLGSWLEQRSWTDVTGFYLTFRIAPLDLGRKNVQENAIKIINEFENLFPGKPVRTEDSEPGLVNGGRMTVWGTCGAHGIGD